MSELKPCKFCGAERGLYVLWDEDTPYVFCDNCKTSVSNERSDTEEQAIAAWNQRAQSEQDMCNQERLVQIGELVFKKEPIRFLAGETYVPERTCHDVSKTGVFFECSECGAIDVTGGIGNYTLEYCPACGAKVVGD